MDQSGYEGGWSFGCIVRDVAQVGCTNVVNLTLTRRTDAGISVAVGVVVVVGMTGDEATPIPSPLTPESLFTSVLNSESSPGFTFGAYYKRLRISRSISRREHPPGQRRISR